MRRNPTHNPAGTLTSSLVVSAGSPAENFRDRGSASLSLHFLESTMDVAKVMLELPVLLIFLSSPVSAFLAPMTPPTSMTHSRVTGWKKACFAVGLHTPGCAEPGEGMACACHVYPLVSFRVNECVLLGSHSNCVGSQL